MCLAVPMTIKEIHDKKAVAEANGIRQQIRIDFLPGIQIGDAVMVHAGFAIEKMDPEEARKTDEIFKEIADVFR